MGLTEETLLFGKVRGRRVGLSKTLGEDGSFVIYSLLIYYNHLHIDQRTIRW